MLDLVPLLMRHRAPMRDSGALGNGGTTGQKEPGYLCGCVGQRPPSVSIPRIYKREINDQQEQERMNLLVFFIPLQPTPKGELTENVRLGKLNDSA